MTFKVWGKWESVENRKEGMYVGGVVAADGPGGDMLEGSSRGIDGSGEKRSRHTWTSAPGRGGKMK
jgi:hypothetical protein